MVLLHDEDDVLHLANAAVMGLVGDSIVCCTRVHQAGQAAGKRQRQT
jgi:hypothetical protein